MASLVFDVADAVVTAINSAELVDEITAERAYRPIHDLPELATMKILVAPRGLTLTTDSRRTPKREIVIDVGVQKKFTAESEVEDLLELCESIASLFHGELLTLTGGKCICTLAEPDPIYDANLIYQQRVFAGVVTLTFEHYGS